MYHPAEAAPAQDDYTGETAAPLARHSSAVAAGAVSISAFDVAGAGISVAAKDGVVVSLV